MSRDSMPGFDRRTVLKSAGSLAALIGISNVTAGDPGRAPGPKKDELIVGVSASASSASAAVEPHIPSNARIVHENETLGYVAVEFPEAAADEARENFKANVLRGDDIEYAEDNLTYEALDAEALEADDTADSASASDAEPLYTPNDPRYGDQYAPQQVNCEGAWETTLGDPNVTIAVVDQGIQYDHPNLAANMDGSVSNHGSDFVDDDGDPYPATAGEDHGTHVGGIAAGGTDNGEGHAGISNCSLLSARALGSDGGGSLTDIADAIQWAADQGADVINLSLGGSSSQTMQNACSYAHGQGSLLVAAAGNDYGGSVSYPAAYDTVLAVSSLDEGETLSAFSNVGPEIELAAPGGNVLSSVNWDDYDSYSGTSMASPVVAGVAGLALSAHPGLSNEELRAHLQETAVDVGLSSNEQGYGRVDADLAVNTEPGDGDDGDDGDDPGDGECGDEVATASAEGNLSGGWFGNPSDSYVYELSTANPCSATLTLEGPASADFDLYVTTDGRTPSTSNYDEASLGATADEEITLDLSGDEELGILVDRYSGSGSYALTIEEYGR